MARKVYELLVDAGVPVFEGYTDAGMLEFVGEIRFGLHWQRSMSRELDLSPAQVSRLASGQHRMQPETRKKLEKLARQIAQAMEIEASLLRLLAYEIERRTKKEEDADK